MVTDPIADILVRIKNAQGARQESTQVPYSNVLWEIAKVLETKGYIQNIDRRGKRIKRSIEIGLKYEDGKGRIDGARRISKPSRRIYKKSTEFFPFKHGHGHEVISTSKGVMTSDDARKESRGGEVLFQIW